MQSFIIFITIFFPVILGAYLVIRSEFISRNSLIRLLRIGLWTTGIMMLLSIWFARDEMVLLTIGSDISIRFAIDSIGRLFAVTVSIVWILGGLFSEEYMTHEKEEKRYFGFYLCVYGVLMALCFSGNLVTYYFFYEAMTILSLPLVFHSKTREALTAGMKYLLYSLFGAYFVLFGIYFLNQYTETLNFCPGGTLTVAAMNSHHSLLLVISLLMILGFGVKSGLFPMHGWLPTAHPVAPAPASAVLSGIIVKMGVLGVIRSVYYIIGPSFIRGTWVQTLWLTLTLITVFMGSMLAYREKLMKKRLAYSTVSQVSYILFGLALLQPQAMVGSLLHVVFHAFIKSCLFLCAGAVIFRTGRTNVDEMRGVGKEMPVVIWCYTIASLALIGIPPASGFISKWYLAEGSLNSGIAYYSWIGPVILLVSALLTAGYLLPITINGFLPGNHYDYSKLVKKEPSCICLVPVIILAALALLLGIMPGKLIGYISMITSTLF